MYLTAFRNGKISDLITKKAFIISNLIADGHKCPVTIKFDNLLQNLISRSHVAEKQRSIIRTMLL